MLNQVNYKPALGWGQPEWVLDFLEQKAKAKATLGQRLGLINDFTRTITTAIEQHCKSCDV